jgi:hypothetical protein
MLETEYENSKLNFKETRRDLQVKWQTQKTSTTQQSTLEPNILTNIRSSNIDDTSRRPSLPKAKRLKQVSEQGKTTAWREF